MSRQKKESLNLNIEQLNLLSSEEQKEKGMKESEQRLRILWNIVKWIRKHIMRIPGGEEREWQKQYLKN